MATRRWRTGWAENGVARVISIFVVLLALAAGSVGPWGGRHAQAEAFVAGDRVVIDTDALNLRRGAGLSYAVIDVLAGGTAVTVTAGPTAADGYRWYRVRTDDDTIGWAAGAYLATGGGGGDGVFTIGQAAVVDTDYLNCRTGAGLKAGVRSALPGGTRVAILDGPFTADGYAWYEVEAADGRLGWVAGEYLAAGTGGIAVGDAVRVVDGPLNLRAGPGLSERVRRVMADGEVLLVRDGPVDADGYAWYRVRNYGGEGWAAGEFLRFDPNGFPPEEGA